MSECRLCLQTEPSIYIFDKIKTLPQKIWNCCRLTVTENDGLSDQICFSCEAILESFNEFKCICEKSEAFLKEQHANRLNLKIDYSNIVSEGTNILELSWNEFNIKQEMPFEEDFLMKTDIVQIECLLEEKCSSKDVVKPEKVGASNKKENVSVINIEIPHLYGGSESVKKKNIQDVKTKCKICGKVLKSNLKRHIRLVHKDHLTSLNATPSDRILVQDKKYNDIKNKKESSLNSNSAMTCNICGKVLHSSSLRRHMLRVHEKISDRIEDMHRKTRVNKNEKLPCRVCNKLIPMRSMRNHIKLHHETNVMLRCDMCNKEFREKRTLKKHLHVMHNSSDTFECDLCQKVFNWKPNIVKHLRRHMYRSLMYKFMCDQCNYRTDSNYKLRQHALAIHMNVRPYQCSVCGKMFKTLNNHKTHMKQHMDQYYFECDYCGRKFKFKNIIVNHIISHMQLKLYQCNICNKKLATKATLKCHMYLHTGENPFSCKLCDKRFKQKCNLRSHLRHFHKMSQIQF